ncbi:ABC transporter permease [Psychromarinibacter sp. C21-152]|uniref:ABC transporter permease n=1 Tax=Psychromarinibacter sediminicola TaxID=3033385 RepID=A0AAE3NSE2_9RHOB|nr:ABC transporter permease [Psychromarinibacter sediminicola]MDF0601212.1 ABC transporter permease [Psychromarinibacter sediminicola]
MRQVLMMLPTSAIRRPITALGVLFLVVIVIFAAASPWIAPYPPDVMDPVNRLLPPGGDHLMGTDHFGRDTFSRVVFGARLALLIGVGVVAFALGTGVPIGVLSALFPALGRVLMRMVDVLMSFPSLLLALGLIVILGQGVFNAILAIGLIYLTTTARIVYGVALRLKAEPYVEAARSAGAGTWWIVTRHILPNMISPLLVQASFVFAFAQLGAASLDFLGLGAPPEIPSWGNMLAESRIYITRASWLLLWPGLMIVLTAFSLNLVGDALRDRMDPRFREMVRR